MSFIKIGTAFNIDLEFEVAPFHKRLMAYIFDLAIIVFYIWGMKSFLFEAMHLNGPDYIGLDILVISLPMLLYSLICEVSMNGQTFGKKILGIRVISLEGGEPTLGQFILRWITKFYEWPFLFGYVLFSADNLYIYLIFTAILGIGAVIIITVTPRSQRLGDLAAGTVVVNTRTELSVFDTVFMHVNNQNYTPKFPEVMKLTDGDINTINNILNQSRKNKNPELAYRVQAKIEEVLQITADSNTEEFLEQLITDYNFLATKEK